jgi:hypothetical protein
MRAFLVACLATVVLGAAGYFFLGAMQEPAGFAFSTEGARITPDWAWRSVGRPTIPAIDVTAGRACEMRKAWQWIFVDFGDPSGEPGICAISQ